MGITKKINKLSKRTKTQALKLAQTQKEPPVPKEVDRADIWSYQIGSVVRDKKHRITHAKIGSTLYDIRMLHQLHEQSGYRFYTTDDNIIKRDILLIKKKAGHVYFATEADWKKENNLDYLPIARLD